MAKLDVSRIRCITFDLDDTLWHCAPTIIMAEAKFYAWVAQYYPTVAENYSKDELRNHRIQFMKGKPELSYNLTALRKAWMSSVGDMFNLNLSWVEDGFQVYWLARNEVRLFAGVEPTLLDLKNRFTTGSITNGNADIHHIGLSHLFDFDVTSIESGAAKPAPASFKLAAQKAGVSTHEMLHVGDHWESDIQGALDAGMQAVWLTQEKKHAKSDVLRIQSVDELLSIL